MLPCMSCKIAKRSCRSMTCAGRGFGTAYQPDGGNAHKLPMGNRAPFGADRQVNSNAGDPFGDICNLRYCGQQKRPGQYCTDLPHIAFNTSASTSVVKSLKRQKQLRTTISFALTSSCHMSYVGGQCGQNKSGSKKDVLPSIICRRPAETSSLFLLAVRRRGVCELDLRTSRRCRRSFGLVLLRFADFLVATQLTLGHGVLLVLKQYLM